MILCFVSVNKAEASSAFLLSSSNEFKTSTIFNVEVEVDYTDK